MDKQFRTISLSLKANRLAKRLKGYVNISAECEKLILQLAKKHKIK